MFSRPWLTVVRRQVLIHRRGLAFVLTVAAVLLGWAAFATRPPVVTSEPSAVPAVTAPILPPGFVRLPVRFADGEMAVLLHPGDRIQLWATDPHTRRSRAIARDAEVLDVPGGLGSTTATGHQSRLVMVAVHVAEVEIVTSFNANGALSYAMAQ